MRKLKALTVAMCLAALSSSAFALDLTNPFNHVTQPQLSAEAAARAGADANLQGQIDGVAAAGQAAFGQVNDHITAVEQAAQIANEKGDAGAVRMDGIEGSLANTDNRSINNAVRLDGVEAGVANLDNKVENYAANGQQQLNDVKAAGAAAISAQADVNTNVQGQLNAGGAVLNQHTSQIATITDVNAAQQVQINTSTQTNTRQDTQISNLQSYASDMDQRLGGRLDSQQSQINSLKRDTKQAKEAAAGALAVAGQQFSTDLSAGFQAAVSVATIGGEQAVAIGAGGAVSENVFINAAFTKSGSTSGGVVSGTYRFK